MSAENADRFNELDDEVKEFLRKASADQIQTLTYLSRIPETEIKGMMKFFRDTRAVGWFLRWAIITLVAIFLGAVTIGENIAKVLGWMRSP